jgi:hypothetical protein
MFSLKTRSKILKAQFVVFMTRRRYVGSYPKVKRFVLVNFLFVVIGFVGWNISLTMPEVSFKWSSDPISFERPVEAKFEVKETIVKEKTIEEKIAETFPENPAIMKAIAQAESGMNPIASHKNINGSVDIGLFQINSVHGNDQLELFDVDKNLAVARQVYEKQGLGAWSAFSNGSYLKYVK